MTKTCHYEILKVARDCNDSELKKAYRAAALQYHPDKNRGREDEAEEEFKLVQEAFEVISDPHARSWYDSHREAILSGRTPGENDGADSAAAATEVDLFSFFTNSCFEKYDDDENGFYTVYRKLFVALADEEKGTFVEFGYSQSSWDLVKSFYTEWEGFNSGKTFGFAEKWNLAEAHDRHERRAMERQNKSARTKAKKDFNASIRELVGFVKKRDPRVKKQKKIDEAARIAKVEERRIKEEQYKLKKKERLAQAKVARDEALEEDGAGIDEILASIELDDKKERRKAKKKMENRKLEEPGDGVEDENEAESEEEEEEEEEIDEDFYCIACKKKFRTQAQYDNHNASKKHSQAVARMKKQMKEDAMFFDTRDSEDVWIDTGDTDPVREGVEKKEEEKEELESKTAKKKRKKKEAKMKQMQAAMTCEASDDDNEGEEHKEEEVVIQTKASKKKKKMSAKKKAMQATLDDDSENEAESDFVGNGEKANKALEGEDTQQKKPMSKKEKRKERERKKAAAEAAHDCNVCDGSFPSKTKLMKHVEKEGHARAVPVEGGGRNRRKR